MKPTNPSRDELRPKPPSDFQAKCALKNESNVMWAHEEVQGSRSDKLRMIVRYLASIVSTLIA
jgi:hypothetical protein